MKNIIIVFALCIMLYSCKCQWYADKAIEKGCLSMDTVFMSDTIRGFVHDTTFRSDTITNIDTFSQVKDGVTVKTIVKWKERTINQTVTKRDTIIKYVKINPTVTNREKCSHTWCWVRFWVVIAMLAGSIFSRFKKYS